METARDPFDELTSLYLGDPPQPPDRPGDGAGTHDDGAPSEARTPRVTVAVCGHLPVMAGLWVTQYADLEAAACGPTGLVRLEGGRCSIELLRAPVPSRIDGDPMSVAAASLVGSIRRWIVCVDDRDAAAAVRAGADEVVVLTSGDQAAVVEAFRLVKSARARAVDPDRVDVGVVIVGADEATTERASATLDRMSTMHLGRPLAVVASVRRLDVVDGSHRIGFDESLRVEADEVVTSIQDALATTPATSAGPPEPSTPSQPPLRLIDPDREDFDELDVFGDGSGVDDPGLHDLPGLDDLAGGSGLTLEVDGEAGMGEFEAIFGPFDDDDETSAVTPDRPAERSAPRSEPARRPERAIDRDRQRPRLPSSVRLGPAPAARDGRTAFIGLDEFDDAGSRIGPLPGGRERRVAMDDSRAAMTPPASTSMPSPDERGWVEPKLGAKVNLVAAIGGLRSVAWRFVPARQVTCAADEHGRLHLICAAEHHGQLAIAREWAMGHRRELAGVAGIPAEAVAEPVLHVVARNAPDVVGLHYSRMHLHLLVEVDGVTRTVPLNDETNRSMDD